MRDSRFWFIAVVAYSLLLVLAAAILTVAGVHKEAAASLLVLLAPFLALVVGQFKQSLMLSEIKTKALKTDLLVNFNYQVALEDRARALRSIATLTGKEADGEAATRAEEFLKAFRHNGGEGAGTTMEAMRKESQS
jgi:hypothetical protein